MTQSPKKLLHGAGEDCAKHKHHGRMSLSFGTISYSLALGMTRVRFAPPLFETLEVLGRQTVLTLIYSALEIVNARYQLAFL